MQRQGAESALGQHMLIIQKEYYKKKVSVISSWSLGPESKVLYWVLLDDYLAGFRKKTGWERPRPDLQLMDSLSLFLENMFFSGEEYVYHHLAHQHFQEHIEQVTSREEDPVAAEIRIRGSAPQTKGDFLMNMG